MKAYEEWRLIVDFPSYEVSSHGRVRRCIPDKLGRPLLVLKTNPVMGYPAVSLHRDAGQKTKRVHLLVAEAFLGARPHGAEVRHKDGNRANPFASNLAYGTRIENQADRALHGTGNTGSRHGMAKLVEGEVVRIRASRLPSALLALALKVSPTTIRSIRRRETWRHV